MATLILDKRGRDITPLPTTVEIELLTPPFYNARGFYEFPIRNYLLSPILYNPYYGEVDIMNEDREYQHRVISYFYSSLVERWLHKKDVFKRLLKYFRVSKADKEATISLVSDPEKNVDQKLSDADIKQIFHFIDKKFITKDAVEDALREYVDKHRFKWYNFYTNKELVQRLLYKELKHRIEDSLASLRHKITK